MSGNTVFRSTDAAATWATAGRGLEKTTYVWCLAIDPRTPSTLYAASETGGVTKSTDSGAGWAAANTGIEGTHAGVHALAIDPVTPSTLYAAASSASGLVFRSTDAGGTWVGADRGLPRERVVTLAIDPSAPATLYAGMLVHGPRGRRAVRAVLLRRAGRLGGDDDGLALRSTA